MTSTLIHADPLHLVFNLYWVWHFGTRLEQVLAKHVVIVALVMLAAFSSTAEYAAGQAGIGLSGVGYGLFTLCWIAGRREARLAGLVDAKLAAIFIAWFVFCILTTRAGLMQVGNIAHASGAALGVPLGIAVTATARNARFVTWAALAFVLGVTSVVAVPLHRWAFAEIAPSDWVQYEAQRLYDSGQEQEAITLLRAAGERESHNSDIYQQLGSLYASSDDWPEAAEAYRVAVQRHPGKGRCWFLLADALGRSNDSSTDQDTEAIAALKKSHALGGLESTDKPIAVEWASYWGYQSFTKSRYKDAAELYRIALELEPDNPTHQDDLDAALAHIGEADAP